MVQLTHREWETWPQVSCSVCFILLFVPWVTAALLSSKEQWERWTAPPASSWKRNRSLTNIPWIWDLAQTKSAPEMELKHHPVLLFLWAVAFRRKSVVRRGHFHLEMVQYCHVFCGLMAFQQWSGPSKKSHDPDDTLQAPCTCTRLLGAVQVSLAQTLLFFLSMGIFPADMAWRAIRNEEFCSVSRLQPPETLKWQKGALDWNKMEKTQQGDFSSSWLSSGLSWGSSGWIQSRMGCHVQVLLVSLW